MGPSQLISGICIVQNQVKDDATSSLEDIPGLHDVSPKNRQLSKEASLKDLIPIANKTFTQKLNVYEHHSRQVDALGKGTLVNNSALPSSGLEGSMPQKIVHLEPKHVRAHTSH